RSHQPALRTKIGDPHHQQAFQRVERSLSQRGLHCDSAGPSPAPCRRDGDRRRQLPGSRKRAGEGGTPAEEKVTPAAELLRPDSNPALYVSSVLTLCVELPDTPLRATASDQWLARRFP